MLSSLLMSIFMVFGSNASEPTVRTCATDLGTRCSDCGFELICNEIEATQAPYQNADFRACIIKAVDAADTYFAIEKRFLRQRNGATKNRTGLSPKAKEVVDDCTKSLGLAQQSYQSPVRVVGESNFHSDTPYPNKTRLKLGGFSGITSAPEEGKLVVVTDDRKNSSLFEIFWSWDSQGASRPVQFQLGEPNGLEQGKQTHNRYQTVDRKGPVERASGLWGFLGFTKQKTYQERVLVGTEVVTQDVDREDLVILSDGRILISTEKTEEARKSKASDKDDASYLMLFSPKGDLISHLKSPDDFLNKGNGQGLDYNLGIEAVTNIPGTDNILFANEGPTLQDRKRNSDRFVRIYLGNVQEMQTQAPRDYLKYKLDPIEGGGLVALAAIDSTRALALERGFDRSKQEATVRLYLINLERAVGQTYVPKRLVVDFVDLKDQFAAGFKKIDNFEGLALGPKIDGQQILFSVSDNNFSPKQRTVLLALAIPEAMLK